MSISSALSYVLGNTLNIFIFLIVLHFNYFFNARSLNYNCSKLNIRTLHFFLCISFYFIKFFSTFLCRGRCIEVASIWRKNHDFICSNKFSIWFRIFCWRGTNWMFEWNRQQSHCWWNFLFKCCWFVVIVDLKC